MDRDAASIGHGTLGRAAVKRHGVSKPRAAASNSRGRGRGPTLAVQTPLSGITQKYCVMHS